MPRQIAGDRAPSSEDTYVDVGQAQRFDAPAGVDPREKPATGPREKSIDGPLRDAQLIDDMAVATKGRRVPWHGYVVS